MDETLRALNRFGLGARIGEPRTITRPKPWLVRQLRADRAALLQGPSLEEIGELLDTLGDARRSRDREALADARRALREHQGAEVRAVVTRRVTTATPLVERLVAFWSNHLCVSAPSKPQVAALAGHYERHVIRPHVLGRFHDMVLASSKHPAMLFYLDNFRSIGPRSLVGRRSSRRGNALGLNENYARELLELHTLGVNGGYDQPDVEALARVLTGWTVAGAGPGSRREETLGFAFRSMLHEPGAKTVLGRRYAAAGVGEGERVIHDLCAHPSTADFVATKLVRHFVADEPPRRAVAAVAEVFRDTDGDLRAVAEALVDLPEAWDPETRKLRTPQDWLVALFRTVHAEEAPRNVQGLLSQLRHALWAPAAPKGFGDLEREWSDPDAIMNRAELARSVARGASRDPGMRPERLLEVMDVEAPDPLVEMLEDDSIPVQERVALAFGGPAFQWR